MEKISYSAVRKNPKRKSCKWHGRIRQNGKERLVALDTQDSAVAQQWVAKQKYLYGEYLAGRLDYSGLLTVDSTPVLAQKRGSGTVLSLGECLEGWEKKKRLEGLRETTMASYGRALGILVDPGMPVTGFRADTVKSIMDSRSQLKAATRRFYSKALLSFCEYLRDEYGVHGICEAIPSIKVDRPAKNCWSREDMQRIISCVECKDKEQEGEYVDYFTIMAAIGSRQRETYLLRWEDYRGGSLRFRAENSKSRKTRVVPVPRSVQERLARRIRAEGPMFPSIPSTQASRYAVLKAAMRRAGVKEGGLHYFRSAVSTLLYRSCTDIKAVSQILGHSAAIALEVYQQARGAEELRSIVDVDLPKW